MLRNAWFIASRDIAYMLRQKETLLWVFLMPFVFFYFIGTVTGGGGGITSEKPVNLAVQAPENGGFLLDELYEALEAENFAIVHPGTEEELEKYARRLIIPPPAEGHATFTDSLLAGERAMLRFVRDGSGISTDLDKVRLGRAVYGLLADLVVLESDGEAVTREAIDTLQAMPRSLTLHVEPAGERQEIPSGYEQTIPGTMVMFTLLVLLTSGSVLLVIERNKGLLRRLASTPISRASVVLGKWTGKMALALVQLAFAMVAGIVFFDIDWGDSLPMVCVVLIAWAAFCTSLAILLANGARSEGQMTGIGVISSMVLAALGGCWWPIEVTADWMQSLARWLPTGWTMGALHHLVNFGHGPESAVSAVVALAIGALVLGAVAAKGFRFQ
jgi:ABC-2 type transport system permease protein